MLLFFFFWIINVQTHFDLDLRREEVDAPVNVLGAPPSRCDAEKYPCSYAVNPEMRNLEDRLKSFSGISDWPAWKLNSTVQDFALAGMFYLGRSRDM